MKEHLVFKKCKNYLIAFFAIHKLSLKNKLYIQTFSVNFLVLENLLICCSLNTANLSWKNFKTRRSILGSDCMTLILLLSLLSECSLIALWHRKMKIDCSRQTCAGRTDRRTKWLLELLSEPKMPICTLKPDIFIILPLWSFLRLPLILFLYLLFSWSPSVFPTEKHSFWSNVWTLFLLKIFCIQKWFSFFEKLPKVF